MGKKKWRDQTNGYLKRVLEQLKLNENVGSIKQASYKDDFFSIFDDAYRSGFCTPSYRFDKEMQEHVQCKSQRPLVCGDAIWSYAKDQGWIHSEMDVSEKKYKDIRTVMTWWDEWTYAWNRNPPPRKRTRKQ